MAWPRRKGGRGFPAVFFGLLAGTLVLLFPSFSPAAPPGTQIPNVASLRFGPGVPPWTVPSNRTTVTVDNAVAVAISPPGSAVVYPGTTVSYRHTVTNRGNVSDVMDLEATSSLGYSYAFYAADGVTPLQDGNGNGRPDVGSLPPGGSVDIVIKIVVPATPVDAKGLLLAAIRDPDPVIFLEHKFLYRRLKEEVPEGNYVTPIGEARVARAGEHVSVISYGAMVHASLEAAARGVALTLSGHTHGGQVRIPGAPVLVRMSRFRLDEGRYEHDGAHIIVSRGLGVSGIPLRIACSPEALLVTLRTKRGHSPFS